LGLPSRVKAILAAAAIGLPAYEGDQRVSLAVLTEEEREAGQELLAEWMETSWVTREQAKRVRTQLASFECASQQKLPARVSS
jgi:hypothetical protein